MSELKFNSKEFLRIKSEWDQILEDSGFEDIESTSGSLKKDSKIIHKPGAFEELSSRAEYNDAVWWFFRTHKFDSRAEEIIWECYAYGMTCSKTALIFNVTRQAVHKRLKKLKEQFNKMIWEANERRDQDQGGTK